MTEKCLECIRLFANHKSNTDSLADTLFQENWEGARALSRASIVSRFRLAGAGCISPELESDSATTLEEMRKATVEGNLEQSDKAMMKLTGLEERMMEEIAERCER